MKLIRTVGAVCAAVAVMLPAAALASGATSVSATTKLTHRTDSGGHGDWAYDNATRKVTLTEIAHDDTAKTWTYHGVLHDDGTFKTIPGAKSPQAGKDIISVTDGTFTGGGNFDFTANHPADSALVPKSVTGDADHTYSWYELFFPSGTTFTPAQGGLFTNWSWTYTAINPCNAGKPKSEHWTDAYYSSGAFPSDGDITGFEKEDPCTLPSPKPSPQPSPAPGSGGGTTGGGTAGGTSSGGSATGGTSSGTQQVSQVPVGAANTGGGGTATRGLLAELSTGLVIVAFIASIGLVVVRRRGARQ